MGLDYRHTCPDIDRSIKAFKSDIESYLVDMLDECCPMLEGKQREDFVSGYVNQMYNDFEANFEGVRKVNEDMRKEADSQIESAEARVNDLEEEIKDLNERIEDLESKLDDM